LHSLSETITDQYHRSDVDQRLATDQQLQDIHSTLQNFAIVIADQFIRSETDHRLADDSRLDGIQSTLNSLTQTITDQNAGSLADHRLENIENTLQNFPIVVADHFTGSEVDHRLHQAQRLNDIQSYIQSFYSNDYRSTFTIRRRSPPTTNSNFNRIIISLFQFSIQRLFSPQFWFPPKQNVYLAP
jgi:hypothetical protein